MKTFILIFCLVCIVRASLIEDKEQWANFKSKHNKSYKNVQEEKLRFSIFQQNLHAIEEHNKEYEAGETTYKKGINRFTDWTKEEINSYLNRPNNTRPYFKNSKSVHQRSLNDEVPESIDWRDYGAVSPIKDQGNCGSCWAFSVVGSLEGFYYLKNNEMITFSEQQLVDCSRENMACGGGLEWVGMEYVKEKGIESENSYPYQEQSQYCHYNESAVVARITDYVNVEDPVADDLLEAVGLLGPISIGVRAQEDLVTYEEGVYTSDSCDYPTNHGVVAVGYGRDEKTGLDYWLVRNSWGADWGEEGYFRIRRGVNQCRIEEEVIYPVF